MLDVQEFAKAIRLGVQRSGLGSGKNAETAGYVSLAGTLLDYLKSNLEVIVPAGTYRAADGEAAGPAVKCKVS